jgi:hypothetical protein
MTEITINPVEVATSLAHDNIILEFKDDSWCKDAEDGTEYTYEAQKKFNAYYDYYYEILTNAHIIKANPHV